MALAGPTETGLQQIVRRERGEPEATTFATVSPRALVRLEGAVYSVLSRWAGLDLVVRIGATTVTIVGRDADSAPAQALGAAVDRLPALPVGARAGEGAEANPALE